MVLHHRPAAWILAIAALIGLAGPRAALASSPKDWHFADGKDFAKGQLEGLSLHEQTGLAIAADLKRVAVPADFVHCWARDGDRLWLGTGLEAKVFVLTGDKVREVAKVPGALVGALAPDGAGGVYVGLVGQSKIVHVDRAGKQKDIATLQGAKHVWALVRRGSTLIAGTGPEGKVLSVDPSTGKSVVIGETGADHVLDLIIDRGGIVAATSAPALLVRLDDGKTRAIASFPGDEVRSVVRLGNALYAAVNGGNAAAKWTQYRATPDRPGESKVKKETKAKAKKSMSRGSLGKGAVWVRTDDGHIYRLFVSPEGMLSQIGAAGQGVVAGSARGGRVVVGDLQGGVESLFDLKEKEVLGVEMGAKGPRTIMTGKGAAVYTAQGLARDPVYTSDVLREVGVARWGRLQVGGSGKLDIETRSGFSDPPGDTWDAWQPLKNGRIQSPPARFLQFRALFKSPDARLTEVRIHRRLFNRKPQLLAVDVKAVPKKEHVYRVTWRALDFDADQLGYVVTYRKRGTRQWLMLHDRFYAKTSLDISPRDMPDGWYEVRVEASDAPGNSPDEALRSARISKPFLVDQGRPEVAGQVRDGVLTGVAADRASNVVRVEVSFDGEPPVLTASADGVFDGLQEAFELKLPKDLLVGAHTLLIQATDEAGNTGVQRLTIQETK